MNTDRPENNPPSLLTAQQVAQRLNVRPTTIYSLCRRKALPFVRIAAGRRRSLIRFSPDAIEALLAKQTIPSDQESQQK